MKQLKDFAKKQIEIVFGKTLEAVARLSRVELGSKWVMIFVAGLNLAAILFFDAQHYPEELGAVFSIALVAEVSFWATYFFLLLFQIRVLKNRESLLFRAVGIIGLSHLLRSITREYLYQINGLTEEFEIWQRLPGDLSLAIFFLMGVAYAQSAIQELAQQEQQLKQAREQLLVESITASNRKDNFQKGIEKRVRQAVLLPLEKILKAITSSGDEGLKNSISKIESLISKKVRPLSKSLWISLNSEAENESILPPKKGRFPQSVHPANDLKIGSIALLGGSNIWFTALGLSNLIFASQFLIVMLSYPLIGWILAGALTNLPKLPRVRGLVAASVISVQAWLPSLIFLGLSARELPQLSVLIITSTLVIVAATLFTAVWSAYKRQRLEYLEEFKSINAQLTRLNTLTNQQNWHSARAWTYLIHGSVQSSLNIALYKITSSRTINMELLDEVLSDLERAKSTLESGLGPRIEWDKSIKGLTDTWQDVCNISINQSPAALKLLVSNSLVGSCVAEICKELVSNAFSHGRAKSITFSLDISRPGELILESQNDGEPVPSQINQGLGSKLFDELTSFYVLENKKGRPYFQGLFPFIENQPE